MEEIYQEQGLETIFALDIGTRSIIGVLGRLENGRFHVLAMEKEEYARRAMLDGQIEDIAQVANVARSVMERLERRQHMRLRRVCVAAAGRALRTQRGSFTLEFPSARVVDDDVIGQLEAGAVSAAELQLSSGAEPQLSQGTQSQLSSGAEPQLSQGAEPQGFFYMVGYTAAQYRLDGYPMSTVKDHRGQKLEVDVVATFLPCEVVESLYAVVARLGLEVASLTLEPIASLNAAIPEDIRLLNLVLVDIGAGTSDIAVCKDGSVVGYTMTTVAGDEITELLMQKLLVDFKTGERLKTELGTKESVRFCDILGMEQECSGNGLLELIQPAREKLAQEIASRILELNSVSPSAVFLAGGGGKLWGLREAVADCLNMSEARVALAGNHFEKSAYSDDQELRDPEYATPLGIAVSAAMGMINDSYAVTLNGGRAKLFRSGVLTLRDILLMNGYHYSDIIGRSGANLSVTVNGERIFFRGTPAVPSTITLNGQEAALSAVIHAGDNIQFTPSVAGQAAVRTLAQVIGEEHFGTVTVNGERVPLSYELRQGDIIEVAQGEGVGIVAPQTPASEEERRGESLSVPVPVSVPVSVPETELEELEEEEPDRRLRNFVLNGRPLSFAPKEDGEPYYLMDLLEYCNLDFQRLERPVELLVNGQQGMFSQRLEENDQVVIRYKE